MFSKQPHWDGSYYRRGYFDDGTPLGSASSEECQIDSLGQSWSVLSGEGEEGRSRQAMDAVMEHLVDEKTGIIRLFTPPFSRAPHDPGYIKGYPPGVRENGGQYTHAATWVVLALAKQGRAQEAWNCFKLLNPVNHALDAASSETYRVEPYVVTADVYGEGAYAGRGGWSWYTGSRRLALSCRCRGYSRHHPHGRQASYCAVAAGRLERFLDQDYARRQG